MNPQGDPSKGPEWTHLRPRFIRLFGTVRLVRNLGRIGTNGHEPVEVFATEIEAGQALEAALEALATPNAYRDIPTYEGQGRTCGG